MTDHIRRRLADLEQRFIDRKPPTFEEFARLWECLTPMDRAAFEADALGDNQLLRSYLTRLGVFDGTEQTLRELAAELDNENY